MRTNWKAYYMPIFHVHCLCIKDSTISFVLGTQLRSERSGGPDFVQVRWHEEKYKDAAARMVRQSLLPLNGDLRLDQVIDAYRRYMGTPMGKLQPVLLYRDMIILLAWSGDQQGAMKLLKESLQISDGTRDVTINRMEGGKHVTESIRMADTNFLHVGGREGFEAECRKLIENQALIQKTIDLQIVALGVGNLPVSHLLH